MPDLTYDDCDTLIEALDKWEKDDASGEIVHGLFGAMLAKDDPEAKAKLEKEREERELERKVARRERERTATLLKAKLYEMQNESIQTSATIR